MPAPIRPKKANGREQNVYWIRKKVPQRYRALVGKTEFWRSLKTTDRRIANERIAVVSAELDREWARLKAEAKRGSKPRSGSKPALTHQDLHALRGEAHVRIRDAHSSDPGTGFAAARWAALGADPATADDEEHLDRSAREFLTREGGVTPTEAEVERFTPLFLKARQDGYGDVLRASRGDYSKNPVLKKLPERTTSKVDIVEALELYCNRPQIKGGLEGPTAKRWRPVIERFAIWIGHRDLARVTPHDAVRWRDHMLSQNIAPKAVRDVWLAAPSSVATYMLNALRLEINPFASIKVDGVKAWKEDDERGFDPEQALTILSATVATPSHLISPR